MAKPFESKYIPLADYFKICSQNEVTLTYGQIETIIGHTLPNAAYLSSSWWKKTKPPALHYFAWADNGFSVKDVKLGKTVTFQVSTLEESQTEEKEKQDIIIIREADLEDARAFITLQESIFSESDFMLYGPNDLQLTVQGMRKRMADWKSSSNSILFLGILNGQFAGFALYNGGPSPRAVHRASLVIGVLKEFYQKGVASSLMDYGERWARDAGITKLELTVVSTNTTAQKLYKKMGFEQEGIRKNSLVINNLYVDELYMGKILT